MNLAIYPFMVLKKNFGLLVIAFIPILFLLSSTAFLNQDYSMTHFVDSTDNYFASNLYLSASDFTVYDSIGAEGIIPIVRLGGLTKAFNLPMLFGDIQNPWFGVVFLTLFLGYLCYAIISRAVYNISRKEKGYFGLRGITPASVILSLLGAFVVLFIASFSLQGFQLVLLINFGVFFAFSIPLAAIKEPLGASLFGAFDFVRFNLRKIVEVYLLSVGAAIVVPIGLLIVFMFPISVIHESVVAPAKFLVSLFGLTFILFYQAVVCSKAVFEFSRKAEKRPSRIAGMPKRGMVKRVKK